MRTAAPAKVNWTLEVLGQREDGYHEVRTVLQTISLADRVELRPARELFLATKGGLEGLTEAENLAARAAEALRGHLGGRRGARVRLLKRIPVAAGLGGGASDAAAVLRGLTRLWGESLPLESLCALASSLGSDVPFFLHGGTALAAGRGEEVTPLPDAPTAHLVVLAPTLEMGEKTARLYAALTPADWSDGRATAALARQLRSGGKVTREALTNVFTPVARAVFPELHQAGEALRAAAGAEPMLAGAGPSLFALVEDGRAAAAAARRLRASGWRAFPCITVPAAVATAVEVAEGG